MAPTWRRRRRRVTAGPTRADRRAAARVLDESFPTMGTLARIVREARGGVDVRSLFAEIECRLSRFDPNSDLSRLNADPGPASQPRRCSVRRPPRRSTPQP